jgi:hypothetical protein
MNDRIEKQIEIAAPWHARKALTDHQNSQWFRVKRSPFAPGRTTRGNITYPGYEHSLRGRRQKMEAPRFFLTGTLSERSNVDYVRGFHRSQFPLAPKGNGTLLTIVESGFDRVPAHRRERAFRMNEGGWAQQMRNIAEHVTAGE